MGKGLYSAGHDRERKKKSKKSVSKKKKEIATQKSSSVNDFQPEIAFSQNKPVSRKALREMQLREEGLEYDQYDQEADTRRNYLTQKDDSLHHAPRALGPQPQKRKPWTTALPDPDLEDDSDLRNASKIAAISIEEQAIVSVDNDITALYSSANNLLTSVRALLNRVNSEHNEEGLVAQDNVERIEMIVSEAILPWINEIETHLEEVLKASSEGQVILETEEIEGEGNLDERDI